MVIILMVIIHMEGMVDIVTGIIFSDLIMVMVDMATTITIMSVIMIEVQLI